MPHRSPQLFKRRPSWRRRLGMFAIVLVIIVAVAALVFSLRPRPGAWLIRTVFHQNDKKISTALAAHTPGDVTTFANELYRPDDPDTRLDVHVLDSTIASGKALPTVVWIHGGAWVSGSKREWAPYFKVLASHGYTVVGIDYSLGPGRTYPTALHQVNDALSYLQENAERLHIDPANIVLAGDSAGAQISSQVATIVTSREYADEVGISPSITPVQLKGVILYCGIYDFVRYFDETGVIGWGNRVAIRAYTGNRATTFEGNPALAEMSSINHVTADFPVTFISGGNGDSLTTNQSMALASRLEDLGVDVTPLFYPDDREPSLPHEYQFNLDTDDGQKALDESVAFLEQVFGED